MGTWHMEISIQKNEELKLIGKIIIELTHVKTGKKTIIKSDNLLTTAGKALILDRLTGGVNTCEITYGAVGTNSTAPAVGNTTLGTELARKVLAGRSYSGVVMTFVTFFSTAEANGAIEEFGLFGDGASGSADSGTLFNHAAISATKTSSYTMTISCAITLT